jgi:hypothetical protein
VRTIFQPLANAVNSHGLRVLVVGGFGVSALSRERMTRDIDLLIATDELPRLEAILRESGYQRGTANHLVVKFHHPSLFLIPVDVLLVNQSTLEKLWQESRQVTIEGSPLRVPKPLHLAAMKFHAMKENSDRLAKDGADIVSLMQAHPQEMTVEAVEAACHTFGTPGIWRRFRAMVGPDDQSGS